ncbi:MAG: hypothetical protein ACOC7Y_02175 [Chloroflexota bacterium]
MLSGAEGPADGPRCGAHGPEIRGAIECAWAHVEKKLGGGAHPPPNVIPIRTGPEGIVVGVSLLQFLQLLTRVIRDTFIDILEHRFGHSPSETAPGGDSPALATPTPAADDPGPRRFSGGELVLYRDRIEFLDQTISYARNKTIQYRILDLLARTRKGEYAAYSGRALADRLGIEGGQESITGAVKNLRRKIRQALHDHGYSYQRDDVIVSGGPGYRLNAWIKVRRVSS